MIGTLLAFTQLFHGYAIGMGIALHSIDDVLGELVIGNIRQHAISVDPTAVIAKGILWNGLTHDLFPAMGITRDYLHTSF